MFKHIVATLVDSPEGRRALETAVHLAAENAAELHLVVMQKDPPASSGFARAVSPTASRLVDDDQAVLEEELTAEAEHKATNNGLLVSTSRLASHLVEGVLEIASERKADLLIVGLQPPTLHVGRLWSKVSELAEQTPCCILGVP